MAGARRAYGDGPQQVAARDLLCCPTPTPEVLTPMASTGGTQPVEEWAWSGCVWSSGCAWK